MLGMVVGTSGRSTMRLRRAGFGWAPYFGWGPGIAVLWSCQRIDVCDSVRLLYLLTYVPPESQSYL